MTTSSMVSNGEERPSKTSTAYSPVSAGIVKSLETLIQAVSTPAETDPGQFFSSRTEVGSSASGFSRTPGLLQTRTEA